MAGNLKVDFGARLIGVRSPVKRDGAPQAPKGPEGKGGPEGTTPVQLGPLPGRDHYVSGGVRPQQAPQPQPPGNTTVVPLGPGFTNPAGPAAMAKAEAEKTARQERPMTLAGGMGIAEGAGASVHYNLADKTALGAGYGRRSIDGAGTNIYSLSMRQYVASEKNWGLYLQPAFHVLQSTGDGGKGWGAGGSAQLGLEWRTNTGITFNVFGGGMYDSLSKKFGPAGGFAVGLSF